MLHVKVKLINLMLFRFCILCTRALSAVDIVPPPQSPIIGRPYSPECIVTNSEALGKDPIVSVQWINSRGEVLMSRNTTGNTSLPLNFAQLSVSDTGSYRCQALIMSPVLD